MIRAFTLIEVLIYLALISLLLSGSLVSAHAVSMSAERNRESAWLEQEGAFILGSIRWELQGATILEPSLGSEGDAIVLQRPLEPEVRFALREGSLMLENQGRTSSLSPYIVQKFLVQRSGARGNPADPERIAITLTISGIVRGTRDERTFNDTVFIDAP